RNRICEGIGNSLNATFPSFEEGSLRPTNRCNATLDRAQRRRSETLLHDWFDLPGRAETKVASHFLDRRGRPSFEEGNRSSLNSSNSLTPSSRHLLPEGEGEGEGLSCPLRWTALTPPPARYKVPFTFHQRQER